MKLGLHIPATHWDRMQAQGLSATSEPASGRPGQTGLFSDVFAEPNAVELAPF